MNRYSTPTVALPATVLILTADTYDVHIIRLSRVFFGHALMPSLSLDFSAETLPLASTVSSAPALLGGNGPGQGRAEK